MLYVNSNENEKTFIKLYEKYYDKIYNYIHKHVFNKEVAEDLTSNTFLNAYNYIKKKDPEIQNFSAWLYKIATNEYLLYHREYTKRKKNISYDENEVILEAEKQKALTDDFSEELIKKEIIRKAFSKLKESEKVILQMHFFDKLKYSEISKALNMNENSVRSKMHRAIGKIRRCMENKYS